ncbi:MAG: hypothetical protein ACFB5Z_07510 [Elainellaceae cyanobacterium]
MAKPTQAHLPKTLDKGLPLSQKEMEKRKMRYYMDAKLLEVGVDPKTVIYRWSVEPQGTRERWTCSAYWGDSKDKIVAEETGD